MKKEIEGYEGRYYITDNGDIFNIKRGTKMAQTVSARTGYLKISLTNSDGIRPTHSVHRLVALSFIPNPENKREVNHKDGNKGNNRVDNLEWVTTKENSKHAHDTGLIQPAKGENAAHAQLTNKSVLKIFNSKLPNKELSAKYQVDICVIYQIKNGKNYSSVTGKVYKAKSSHRPKELLLRIFNEGGGNSEIGKKYNLPAKEVWRIRNSKTFSNL